MAEAPRLGPIRRRWLWASMLAQGALAGRFSVWTAIRGYQAADFSPPTEEDLAWLKKVAERDR